MFLLTISYFFANTFIGKFNLAADMVVAKKGSPLPLLCWLLPLKNQTLCMANLRTRCGLSGIPPGV